MKLVHPDFLCPIEFKENQIQTIVIESPRILSKYLEELLLQVNGADGRWVLSEYEVAYSLSKASHVILNPFCLEFNQRRMLTALYDRIEKETLSTELLLKWNKLYPAMVNILEEMIKGLDYMLSYSEGIEIKEFLKIMNLRFNNKAESMVEQLIDYMCLLHEVLKISVFVFVNIKSYLDENELNYLFQQAFYQKIYILLLENVDREQKHQAEQIRIIDRDCCIIDKNVR